MIAGPIGISRICGYAKTAHLQAESLKRCKPDPPMPDQEQLDDFLEALETAGSPAKNPVLRQALGWEEALYEEVKADQVGQGKGQAQAFRGLGGCRPLWPWRERFRRAAGRRGAFCGGRQAEGGLGLGTWRRWLMRRWLMRRWLIWRLLMRRFLMWRLLMRRLLMRR